MYLFFCLTIVLFFIVCIRVMIIVVWCFLSVFNGWCVLISYYLVWCFLLILNLVLIRWCLLFLYGVLVRWSCRVWLIWMSFMCINWYWRWIVWLSCVVLWGRKKFVWFMCRFRSMVSRLKSKMYCRNSVIFFRWLMKKCRNW